MNKFNVQNILWFQAGLSLSTVYPEIIFLMAENIVTYKKWQWILKAGYIIIYSWRCTWTYQYLNYYQNL